MQGKILIKKKRDHWKNFLWALRRAYESVDDSATHRLAISQKSMENKTKELLG